MEQRIVELVGLEAYFKRRKKDDGLTRAPEQALKMIREELRLLRKRLESSYS